MNNTLQGMLYTPKVIKTSKGYVPQVKVSLNKEISWTVTDEPQISQKKAMQKAFERIDYLIA